MKSGYIVLCNHTSPLDILYLNYIMSPMFIKVYYKQNLATNSIESFLFASLSFLENYRMLFSNSYIIPENLSTTKSSHRKMTLIKIIEESFDMRLGAALIFFEGGLTNGSGVLKLDANFLENIRLAQIKYHRPTVLICIDYSGNEFFSPKDPTENEFYHLIKMMGNLQTKIEIRTHTIHIAPESKEEYLDVIKSFYFQYSKDELDLNWIDYRAHLINKKKILGFIKDPLLEEKNKIK